jgi:hypothetical protein
MSEQEKYQRLKEIALRISKDKKIIHEKGVEQAAKEHGIKFVVPQSTARITILSFVLKKGQSTKFILLKEMGILKKNLLRNL